MAVKQVMISDLTGTEGDPSEFCTFVIRSGPGIEKAIAFDAKPSEIGNLDAAKDIYVVEIRRDNDVSQPEQIVCTLKELTSKVVPTGKTLEELIEAARFLRGRRPTNGR